MTLVTIVIPVGPAHGLTGIYQEAAASAQAQTLPVEVIVQHDAEGRGASWCRNTAMRQVKTDFVVWLDADDLLHPQFVEQTLARYRPGHYVYTDFTVNGQRRFTPDHLNIWEVGQEHITTTLLPTAAWKLSGGFDETLDTLEDEDFYRKLHAYGWCGVRCPEALVDYRRTQGNSRVNADRHDLDWVKARVAEKAALFTGRYASYMASCNKCGGGSAAQPTEQIPAGVRGPNDVLAKALYSPMSKMGPISGRKYARIGLGDKLWVDADDVAARPEWWQKVADNPVKHSPDVKRIQQLVRAAKTAHAEPA